jgi:signal peptidase I
MKIKSLEMAADTELQPVQRHHTSKPTDSAGFKRAVGRGFSLIPHFIKVFLQCVMMAALAFGCYWVINKHIFSSVEVVGVSMVPTLHNSDHYLLDRWTYMIRDPQPNDIVVIRDPQDDGYAVKRIIGREGDSIYLKQGRVYVNGRILDEPYLLPGTPTYGLLTRRGEQWIVCGKDRYFVMGDNRNNSSDSRIYGSVPRQNILGTVVVR